MSDNNIGSQWRIWDLQVQTILDDGYISISDYINDLKRDHPSQFQELVSVMGSEENIIKYDDKNYFHTGNGSLDSEELRTINYARLFVNFIDIFNPQGGAICITDHNYAHNCLIDHLVKSSEYTKVKIIPGVEINVQGVHMLVLFGTKPYQQNTYASGIKTFLSKINILTTKKEGVLSVSDKSYTDVINEINSCGGILIYPHCNSNNGLFQERGKTDRTHLADQFNFQNPVLLQSQNKSMADSTIAHIDSKSGALKALYGMTLGTDARCLRDILKPDANGNYCWIKADTTFEGLKRVMYEPDDRIFLGFKPDLLKRVELDRTQYINELTIKQAVGYSGNQGEWFKNVTIPFNPGLTAIIGNKGSGKSAIADILGLVGNSYKTEQKFSFLNTDRFKKKGLAKNFEATIKWVSGETTIRNLGDGTNKNSPEMVRYLPQRYFEDLTNEQDSLLFQHTLEDVIFGYLPDYEKLGLNSFQDLILDKKRFIDKKINSIRDGLSAINIEIANLEIKLESSYRANLTNQKEAIEKQILDQDKQIALCKEEHRELLEQRNTKDTTVSLEVQDIQRLEKEIAKLDEQISFKKQEYNKSIQRQSGLENLIKSIGIIYDQIKTFKAGQAEEFKNLGFDIEEIVKFAYDSSKIETALSKSKEDNIGIFLEICDHTKIATMQLPTSKNKEELVKKNFFYKRGVLEKNIADIKKGLTEQEQKFHEYEKSIKTFESKKKELEGSTELPGTLKNISNQIDYLDKNLTVDLEALYVTRMKLSGDIYKEYMQLLELYKTIKGYVDSKISEFPNGDADQIHIDVGVMLNKDFSKDFIAFILKNKKGSFSGNDNAEIQLKNLIQDKDLDSITNIQSILTNIVDYLKTDQRSEIREDDKVRNIREQIANVPEFYDYLFGLTYLEIKYDLGVGEKKISELSPGERGTLLLIFYLMIDKETLPLIIDQPEDNLDNQSVYHKLSKFIKEAKKRRQIIIVTHNPNLAIGADAENIVKVHIDKANNHVFSYESGAIEKPEINNIIVTILEGTMIAFQGRDKSYIK